MFQTAHVISINKRSEEVMIPALHYQIKDNLLTIVNNVIRAGFIICISVLEPERLINKH